MNGALQQLDQSAAAAICIALPAWNPDYRAGKKPEGEWHRLPSSFIGALKSAEPFVGRNQARPYFMGVCLHGEHAYATNDSALVEVDVGAAVPSAMIPLWLVRLLTKRESPPHSISVCARSIAFDWEDGTWVSAAPCREFPAKAIAKFEEWREPTWEMSAAWKKEFRAIAGVSDETIIIGPDHIQGGHGVMDMSSEVETPVADGTVWHPKVLAPVIKLADRIDFSSWPNPACFAFANGRGFVLGKN